MPAISSSAIFTNMRVPNFAALKTKSTDATASDKSEQKYLRRLQKEQKRQQPQLFIHGHPAVAPRCAIAIFTNMRVPNFAALKTKSADATASNKSEQKYLRRLQKEQKRQQPQLFSHGHPAVAPRCAM
ncbi:hypothetical protein BJ742DRAFT_856738 [Cladochytrium replicatum]|nr:hypothetical protein BJ742DRAFT_856738 [Cladochytrium replicatum]